MLATHGLFLSESCASDGKHAHGTSDGDGSDQGDGDGLPGDAGAPSRDAASDLDATFAADAAGEASISPCTACTTCEHAVNLPATANHIEGNLTYSDPPPAGGDHNPCWLNFGVYDEERPDERWVHNLEHGGVVFLYNCPEGCTGEVAGFKKLMQGKAQVLLTPYAALPTKFAAVSWGYRLLTDCFDTQQFATFYTNRVDRGPESIKTGPSSAYCPP